MEQFQLKLTEVIVIPIGYIVCIQSVVQAVLKSITEWINQTAHDCAALSISLMSRHNPMTIFRGPKQYI